VASLPARPLWSPKLGRQRVVGAIFCNYDIDGLSEEHAPWDSSGPRDGVQLLHLDRLKRYGDGDLPAH
jgi:hypothetical protein